MEIRFLTGHDATLYRGIRLEALECEPEAFGSSVDEFSTLTLDDIATRLSADSLNNFVVGAFADARLLGTAGVFRDKGLKERHKGHIWGVYVTPEARGKRAGHEMLRALLERAAKIEGIEQMMLSVATPQTAAVRLYRSFGFESYGCERRALKVGDRYVDEEHMVLYLDPLIPRLRGGV